MELATSLAPAATILALGARGVLDGAPFVLAGRTCVRGRSGALWNEWTVRFDDERRAFLAEAGGRFTMYEEASLVPAWEAVVPDASLDTGYVVIERGVATRLGRWGDVDAAPPSYRYADLSSRTGASATIDYGSSPPHLFVGRRLTLAELSLAPHIAHPRLIPAPEVSRPSGVDVWLDPGLEGDLDGTRFRVLGMLGRSGGGLRWDEYLLHEAQAGFRWLVVADGHWSLVQSVEVGLVREADSSASLASDRFDAISEVTARVDWATGELPWSVAIGDESLVKEFGRADGDVLTKESTLDSVGWSHGTPIASELIARAFGKRALPKPSL